MKKIKLVRSSNLWAAKRVMAATKAALAFFKFFPSAMGMQSLILNRGSAQALAEQASSEGVRKLRQAGLLKVLQGLTSAQEGMAMTQHG